MTRKWLCIAKAEFFVLTASVRKHRYATVFILYALGAVWAGILAPMMMGGLITMLGTLLDIQPLMVAIFPGLMRTMMLFLFMLLLLFPLSYALQEIKIGEWEIFLSNNVNTRNILTGTFAGSIPIYAFITLILAPVLISPFTFIFQVSPLGIVLMYTVVVLLVISTLWMSNFITSWIKARLGDSSRGNDIAKGLSVVIAVLMLGPLYGVMFFAPAISDFIGLNVFLLMPFTWFADAVTWIAITFNGIGLTSVQILNFGSVLQLDLLTIGLLIGGFSVLLLVGTLGAAGRIFTISAGARTETVTTVGRENVAVRGIRRIVGGGAFGSLVAVSLKDYFRKAQNLSKLFYGAALATIMPLLMSSIGDYYDSPGALDVLRGLGMMFALVGAFPIAGTAFLESKNQLWILQGAPHGASRYVKARVITTFMTVIPLAIIPVTAMAIMFRFGVADILTVALYAFIVVCGASMVAIGVTAKNPNYEDTKSPAHQANIMMAMMIPIFALMAPLFADIFLSIMGLDVGLIATFGEAGMIFLFIWAGPLFLLGLGALFVLSGIRSLSRPEV